MQHLSFQYREQGFTHWGCSGGSYSSLGCSLGTVAIVIPTSEHTNPCGNTGLNTKKMIPVDFLFPEEQIRSQVNPVFILPSPCLLLTSTGLTSLHLIQTLS